MPALETSYSYIFTPSHVLLFQCIVRLKHKIHEGTLIYLGCCATVSFSTITFCYLVLMYDKIRGEGVCVYCLRVHSFVQSVCVLGGGVHVYDCVYRLICCPSAVTPLGRLSSSYTGWLT